jgi:lipoate-protein ligase A
MALDERLARRLAEVAPEPQSCDSLPVLRLFQWSPWAISLGYNQEPKEIDMGACTRDGIDVVRRPTGGRAILHAEELTYSVVMIAGRKSILQLYKDISSALVRGVAAEFCGSIQTSILHSVLHELGPLRDRVGGKKARRECPASVQW